MEESRLFRCVQKFNSESARGSSSMGMLAKTLVKFSRTGSNMIDSLEVTLRDVETLASTVKTVYSAGDERELTDKIAEILRFFDAPPKFLSKDWDHFKKLAVWIKGLVDIRLERLQKPDGGFSTAAVFEDININNVRGIHDLFADAKRRIMEKIDSARLKEAEESRAEREIEKPYKKFLAKAIESLRRAQEQDSSISQQVDLVIQQIEALK